MVGSLSIVRSIWPITVGVASPFTSAWTFPSAPIEIAVVPSGMEIMPFSGMPLGAAK